MCDAVTANAQSLKDEAAFLLNRGCYAEAEPLLQEAMQSSMGQLNAAGQENGEAFMWMRRLVQCYAMQGKYAEAEPIARTAARGSEYRWGPDDEDVLDCKYWLTEVLFNMGAKAEAEELMPHTLPGLEANLKRGPEHCTTLRCKALYAKMLRRQRRSEEADSLAQNALDVLEAVLQRAETRSEQGGYRMAHADRNALSEVKNNLSEQLGLNKPMIKLPPRSFSKDTESTAFPCDSSPSNFSPFSRQKSSARAPSNLM